MPSAEPVYNRPAPVTALVPRLVKQMFLRDVPVELAMHLLVGFLEEFADFTDKDVTVEWPNGVYHCEGFQANLEQIYQDSGCR